MKNRKEIRQRSLIRSYTYVATISTITGKLLRITAGCRTWRDFDHAYRHYKIERWWGTATEHHEGPIPQMRTSLIYHIAARREALSILDLLKEKVERYQAKRRARRTMTRAKAPIRRKRRL